MTSESTKETKAISDANTRAILIGKLSYKLNLEDPAYDTDQDIGRAWLKGIKRQFDIYDITEDDQKVSACLKNLLGYMEDFADDHGKFDLFDEFEEWFRKRMRIPERPDDISQELKDTIQDGKFRPYGKKFLALEAKNLLCKYPRSEDELMDAFLLNMRNNKLRDVLLLSTANLGDRIVFAEKLIRNGTIWDYNDPRASRSTTSSYRVEKPPPSGPTAGQKRSAAQGNYRQYNRNGRWQEYSNQGDNPGQDSGYNYDDQSPDN
ncbi:hypothetical protein METSCH_E03590 [Metschnikowia aff. pulcherrima]|uniref:Uncharacterized protein n=1 Tax=Metschnikowia aff. pulcherrima TaxID=2163413 RepID=A0A4P6XSM1_9ASCO|nr:hypothetical protein METSCH_E03590 [Metschnikowia aff. pulcherrima]